MLEPGEASRFHIIMPRIQQAFYYGFVVAMVLCWSPSNVLAYLAPLAFLAVVIVLSYSDPVLRNSILILAGYVSIALTYNLLYSEYVFGNAIIALLTYGSFIPVLAIPNKYLGNERLFLRMGRIIAAFVVIQSLWGLVQALYGLNQTGSFDLANGDFVEGTIHAALESERSFSNPMFAVNMAFLLLALVVRQHAYGRGKALPFWLASLAFVVASVLHAIAFFLIALVSSYALFRPTAISSRKLIRQKASVVAFLAVPVLAFLLLRTNVGTIAAIAHGALLQQYPKTVVAERFISKVPQQYAFAPYVGLGPGQYTSRASFIGTGMYFGASRTGPQAQKLPLGAKSAPFSEHVEDLWLTWLRNPHWGSTQGPHSSWTSLLSETGLLGVCLLMLVGTGLFFRLRRAAHDRRTRVLAFAVSSGVVFLFLLGFQENYWEVTQAIFPGVLILKVLYACLVYPAQRGNSVPQALVSAKQP